MTDINDLLCWKCNSAPCSCNVNKMKELKNNVAFIITDRKITELREKIDAMEIKIDFLVKVAESIFNLRKE